MCRARRRHRTFRPTCYMPLVATSRGGVLSDKAVVSNRSGSHIMSYLPSNVITITLRSRRRITRIIFASPRLHPARRILRRTRQCTSRQVPGPNDALVIASTPPDRSVGQNLRSNLRARPCPVTNRTHSEKCSAECAHLLLPLQTLQLSKGRSLWPRTEA